ncbi:pseudouridine synthase [Cupriavidus sp. UGS-1]|uniref:pseudouridine synthase n=1 Tax=Cupriavidus sp. UGS-1 TaxID=2899826 RepID=UPI001E2FA5B0|nr:pseudouridine synthase [Cupriavidus sp. UGS-1]MCD9123027.1 pseudouridine synthase [Cupriavidus sp. UGS-1]
MTLIALNKPFGTMSQFSPHPSRQTLADWIAMPDVYPAGRLDADSEGLLLLTDDGVLQARIADPRQKLAKTYLAQVEGVPDEAALARLRAGLDLGDFHTLPAQATLIDEPAFLWPRTPPIRYRAAIPTQWIEIEIHEGKNRQVRRMTAAVGHPTLRLVRVGIGALDLRQLGLAPGQWQEVAPQSLGMTGPARGAAAVRPRPNPGRSGGRRANTDRTETARTAGNANRRRPA